MSKQNSNQQIRQCEFQLSLTSGSASIKFPCQFYVQWKSSNNKLLHTSDQRYKLTDGMLSINEKFTILVNLIFIRQTKQYSKKDTYLTLNLVSINRPNQPKLVGRYNLNLADIPNNSQYETQKQYKLVYSSVNANLSFSCVMIGYKETALGIKDLEMSDIEDFRKQESSTINIQSKLTEKIKSVGQGKDFSQKISKLKKEAKNYRLNPKKQDENGNLDTQSKRESLKSSQIMTAAEGERRSMRQHRSELFLTNKPKYDSSSDIDWSKKFQQNNLKINQLQGVIKELSKVKNNNDVAEEVKGKLKEVSIQKDMLLDELEKLKQINVNLQIRCKEQADELETKIFLIQSKSYEIKDQNQQLSKLKSKFEYQSQEKIFLQQNIEEMQKRQQKRLEQFANNLKKDCKEDQSTIMIKELRHQLDQIQIKNKELQDMVSAEIQVNQNLKIQLEQVSKKFNESSEKQQQMKDIQIEITKSPFEKQQISKNNEIIFQQLSYLQKSNQQYEQEYRLLQEEYGQMNEKYNNQLQDLKGVVMNLKSQLDNLTYQLESQKNQKHSAVKKLEKEQGSLKEKQLSIKTKKLEYQEKIESFIQRQKVLREKTDLLGKQTQKIAIQIQEKQKNQQNLREQIQYVRQESSQLKIRNSELQNDLNTERQRNQGLENQLQLVSYELENLDKLNSYMEEVSKLKEQTQNLKKQNQILKEKSNKINNKEQKGQKQEKIIDKNVSQQEVQKIKTFYEKKFSQINTKLDEVFQQCNSKEQIIHNQDIQLKQISNKYNKVQKQLNQKRKEIQNIESSAEINKKKQKDSQKSIYSQIKQEKCEVTQKERQYLQTIDSLILQIEQLKMKSAQKSNNSTPIRKMKINQSQGTKIDFHEIIASINDIVLQRKQDEQLQKIITFLMQTNTNQEQKFDKISAERGFIQEKAKMISKELSKLKSNIIKSQVKDIKERTKLTNMLKPCEQLTQELVNLSETLSDQEFFLDNQMEQNFNQE